MWMPLHISRAIVKKFFYQSAVKIHYVSKISPIEPSSRQKEEKILSFIGITPKLW
ncbi:hypothetical protein [Rodentibacter caecimuris]|uniref:hypothetical protein n=1 Tax=Rodentibacter caecimuris TaxID=1796644 RepID=UPI0015C33001